MPTPNITIVSEDKYSLDAILRGLQELGFQARAYNNLKLALQTALSTPPALIVFDLALDDLQLKKLVAFLRQKDKLRSVPLIVITDVTRSCLFLRSADERMAILTKPLTLGTLLSHIRRLLLDSAADRSQNRPSQSPTVRYFSPGRKTESASSGSDTHPMAQTNPIALPEKTAAAIPPGSEPPGSIFLSPRIHSVNARWIAAELEITVNGCHFLSTQEMREALSIGVAGSTQIILDGVAMPTLFFSSSQLKSRIPAGQLAGRRQCTLQVAHPAPASVSTPGMVITLPPSPADTGSQHPQALLSSVTPNELPADSSDIRLIVEGQHISLAAKAYWDGREIPMQRLSSKLATVALGALEVGRCGIHLLSLGNSEAGLKESNALQVLIRPPNPEAARPQPEYSRESSMEKK